MLNPTDKEWDFTEVHMCVNTVELQCSSRMGDGYTERHKQGSDSVQEHLSCIGIRRTDGRKHTDQPGIMTVSVKCNKQYREEQTRICLYCPTKGKFMRTSSKGDNAAHKKLFKMLKMKSNSSDFKDLRRHID